jgi:hypothetical protein
MVATFVDSVAGCVEGLARFFPEVRPAGMPALLELRGSSAVKVREAIVIEFASAEKAVFHSRLPLEFEDRVLIENDRGHGIAAKVIAVQYRDGRTAVAVQVIDRPFSWITRP